MSRVLNSCGRCGKEVHQNEKKIIVNKIWHELCFSCVKCKKLLCPANYCTFKKEIYCRTCYTKEHSGKKLTNTEFSDNSDTCPPYCKGEATNGRQKTSTIQETRNLRPSEIKQIVKNKLKNFAEKIGRKKSGSTQESHQSLEQQELLFISESGTTKIIKVTSPKLNSTGMRNNSIKPKIYTRLSKNGSESNDYKIMKDSCVNTCGKCKILRLNSSERNLTSKSTDLSKKRSQAGYSSTKIQRNRKINNYNAYYVPKNYGRGSIDYENHKNFRPNLKKNSRSSDNHNLNHFHATNGDKNSQKSTRQVKNIDYLPPKYDSKQKQRENSHFLESFEEDKKLELPENFSKDTSLIQRNKNKNVKNIKQKSEFASIEDFKTPVFKKFQDKNTQYYRPTMQSSKLISNKNEQTDNKSNNKISKSEIKDSKKEKTNTKPKEIAIKTEENEKKNSLLGKLFFFPTCNRRKLEAQKKNKRMSSGQCRIKRKISYYQENCVVTAEICPTKRYVRNSNRKVTEKQTKKSLDLGEVCNNKNKFIDFAGGDAKHSNNSIKKLYNDLPAILKGQENEENKNYSCNKKHRTVATKLKKINKEFCNRCKGQVFIMERRVTDNGVFHDKCFRCFFCNKFLDSLNLVPKQDEILCKHCYNKFYGPQIYGFGVQNNVNEIL